MTTEMREKLSFRVKKMKTSYGVSYSHIARQLDVHSQTVLHFANGRIDCMGEEKLRMLAILVQPFFPEPKAKQVANEQ